MNLFFDSFVFPFIDDVPATVLFVGKIVGVIQSRFLLSCGLIWRKGKTRGNHKTIIIADGD